jgi:hypothetical protein
VEVLFIDKTRRSKRDRGIPRFARNDVWVTARFDENVLETLGEEGLVRGGGDGMISVFLRLGAHSAAPRTIGTNVNCVCPAFPLRLYDCGYYSESVYGFDRPDCPEDLAGRSKIRPLHWFGRNGGVNPPLPGDFRALSDTDGK